MKKSVTYEKTLNKKDIEMILREYFETILDKEDFDFKNARWMQDDFTYNFKDGQPSIDIVFILDEVKKRKPK